MASRWWAWRAACSPCLMFRFEGHVCEPNRPPWCICVRVLIDDLNRMFCLSYKYMWVLKTRPWDLPVAALTLEW
jgi:hypothetical protein